MSLFTTQKVCELMNERNYNFQSNFLRETITKNDKCYCNMTRRECVIYTTYWTENKLTSIVRDPAPQNDVLIVLSSTYIVAETNCRDDRWSRCGDRSQGSGCWRELPDDVTVTS